MWLVMIAKADIDYAWLRNRSRLLKAEFNACFFIHLPGNNDESRRGRYPRTGARRVSASRKYRTAGYARYPRAVPALVN